MWAENPRSPSIRECVATLASNNNYGVVEILMTSACQIRYLLGSEFQRLQHFIMKLAIAGDRYSLDRQGEVLAIDFKSLVRREWNAFVKGSLEPSVTFLEQTQETEGLDGKNCKTIFGYKRAISWWRGIK